MWQIGKQFADLGFTEFTLMKLMYYFWVETCLPVVSLKQILGRNCSFLPSFVLTC